MNKNNKIERLQHYTVMKVYVNVVLLSLSLQISYCITLVLLLLVMMWGDKMPTWWDDVRWVTQAMWHSVSLLLTFWGDRSEGGVHLPPDCSWPRLTQIVESETVNKGGPTVVLDWSERQLQNNNRNNVLGDHSIWVSDMNDSNVTRDGRQELEMIWVIWRANPSPCQ